MLGTLWFGLYSAWTVCRDNLQFADLSVFAEHRAATAWWILPAVPLEHIFYAENILALTVCAIVISVCGDLITKFGLGNGLSVILSVAILSGYGATLRESLLPALVSGTVSIAAVAAWGLGLAAFVAAAVLVTEGVRKVPITYFTDANTQVGVSTGRGRDDHVPFRINPTGMQPVIIASFTLSAFPFMPAYGSPLYLALQWPLIFAATFIDMENVPGEISEYLNKVGARVPGVRPGKQTVKFFRYTQISARFVGGALLATLATIATVADASAMALYGQQIGFTSTLIVISTLLSIRRQIRTFRTAPTIEDAMVS